MLRHFLFLYSTLHKMTKEEMLHRAIKIADKAHKGQTDKYHAPYIAHVMRVMEYGKTLDEKIVGVLHDVVEDHPLEFSLDYLRDQGFPEYIIFAISCLTKFDPNEEYDDFVRRTERSPLAVAVKLNDLRDNMDLRRVNRELTPKDIKRFNKYLKAYHYLIEKY